MIATLQLDGASQRQSGGNTPQCAAGGAQATGGGFDKI
jgi:hypothetical protein